MNRGSVGQVPGQTNDQTSMTTGMLPRRLIKGKVGKSITGTPRKVVVYLTTDDLDEWENWAAEHPESALGVTA